MSLRHIKKDVSYSCRLCGVGLFLTIDEVKQHMKEHEKPNECIKCGKDKGRNKLFCSKKCADEFESD